MYKVKGFLTSLLLVGSFIAQAQNTHIVDLSGTGDFVTIHEAVEAASTGDTIRVQPDQYPFTASLGKITVNKKLIIIGSGYMPVEDGGTELIDIAGQGFFALTSSADGSVIKGFRIQGATNFLTTESGTNATTIEENMFIEGANILSLNGSQDTVRSNVFVGTGTNSVQTSGANTQITNNLFSKSSIAGHSVGMVSIVTSGSGVIIAYNLFLNGSFALGYSGTGAIRINAGAPEVYSNGFVISSGNTIQNNTSAFITNNGFYNSTVTGLNPVETSPGFEDFDSDNEELDLETLDEDSYDITLASTSGWKDTGRTGTLYLDTDGSRSDIGIYAGPSPFRDGKGAPSVPVVIDFQVSPTTVSPSGTITIKATGRIGSGNN